VENNFGCENALLLSVMFREEIVCGDFGGYVSREQTCFPVEDDVVLCEGARNRQH
jgi:hypothetical protein